MLLLSDSERPTIFRTSYLTAGEPLKPNDLYINIDRSKCTQCIDGLIYCAEQFLLLFGETHTGGTKNRTSRACSLFFQYARSCVGSQNGNKAVFQSILKRGSAQVFILFQLGVTA